MGAVSVASLRNLSPRERRVLAVGGLLAAVLFVMAVVLPLERHVAQLRRAVASKTAELAWLRRVAPELAAAGPVRRGSTLPLIVLIDQSARQSGLGSALTGSTPSGPSGLTLQLQRAPFDRMVGWLARLHQNDGVEVKGARIEAAGAPGLVNASLDLQRP
jgi:general secretion pathway protein M